ncbi:biotin--[acetyl-CoA-carboxylase] ligase, partial [Planctomycetota bacterium]
PNDVYLEGKKICGILIERPTSRTDYVVIGVGVNVNNSIANAPPEIADTANSLVDCLETEVDRTAVLIECLQQIDRRIRSIRLGDALLLDQWRAYCILTGRRVTVDIYEREISGICSGIDSNGALVVQSGDDVHQCVGGIVKDFF